MPEIAALEKHPCAACGAQAEWNPAKQKLVCPFCGTEAPYAGRQGHREGPGTGPRRRRCARSRTSSAGWQTERRSVQCQSCKAVMVYDPARVGQNCEFCGSPALVDYEEIKSPIRPQSLLPFKITAGADPRAHARLVRRPVVRPSAAQEPRRSSIRSRDSTSRTGRSTRRPSARGRAEAGYYYYVTESYTDNQGKRQTRQVRKVRWEPASGHVSSTSSTTSRCPGAAGSMPGCCAGIEPFPTKELVPYDTAFLSGFVVEHYQVVLLDAAKQARERDERGTARALFARRSRATRSGTSRSSRPTRPRRSSTSWCRSGC